jgi:hypothetical protein
MEHSKISKLKTIKQAQMVKKRLKEDDPIDCINLQWIEEANVILKKLYCILLIVSTHKSVLLSQ